MDYILSLEESAEIKAAEICKEFQEKNIKCIVLSRDYDPLQIIDEMLQPYKITEKVWILRLVRVDRECLKKYLTSP